MRGFVERAPSRRDGWRGVGVAGLAGALTLALLSMILLPGARPWLRAPERAAPGVPAAPPERVVFVAPSATAPALGPNTPATPAAAPSVSPTEGAAVPAVRRSGFPARADSAATAAGAPRPPAAGVVPSFTGPLAPPAAQPGASPQAPRPNACIGPCAAAAPSALALPSTAGRTQAARDSVLRTLGASIPGLARRVVPLSPAERDSIARTTALEGGGGAASPSSPAARGGVSVGVPLPGGGPTRAQRQRDSALHADNIARLKRIRIRLAEVGRDTLVRLDSSAGRTVRPPRE